MDVNSDFWLQLILGSIVLIPSIWAIWKNYYDRFKIDVILDKVCMGIHEWDTNRFEIRFFIPMEVFNISNSMGIITDMRLEIRYRMKAVHYSEYVWGEFDLISKDSKKFDYQARGSSLHSIVKSEVVSFALKPQQHCKKNILFRTFWNNLRVIDKFEVILEIQLNNKWKKYGRWSGHLRQREYDLFIANGSRIPLGKMEKDNWFAQKWKQHMLQKIDEIYGADVEMQAVNLPVSRSKW